MVARSRVGRKSMTRLIIGANKRQLPGYVHHDVLPLEGIDICCDFWDLPKHVEANSCEEIQMTHVLEHFPIAKTSDALTLVRSLLTDNGQLYIEVPNFKWHAEMILRDPYDMQIVEYAYGGQIDQYDFHYIGFTPEILSVKLLDAGFTIQSMAPNSSIECWVKK